MVDNDILIVVSIRSLDQESNIKIPDTLILILILTAIRNSKTGALDGKPGHHLVTLN